MTGKKYFSSKYDVNRESTTANEQNEDGDDDEVEEI